MLAKKIALGIGIAVTLPILVHFGVRTLCPSPRDPDYQIRSYYQQYQKASPEEKTDLEMQRKKQIKKFALDSKRFSRTMFSVALLVGITAIIIVSIIPIQAVGTGLMFGGIFTLINGYFWYWPQLSGWMRLVSLLMAFAILSLIGYRKLAK